MVREGTVAAEVLTLLGREGRLNTNQVARRLGKNYHHVRDVLEDLERNGLVGNEPVRRYVPLTKAWIVVNEWFLTKEGYAWLRRAKK